MEVVVYGFRRKDKLQNHLKTDHKDVSREVVEFGEPSPPLYYKLFLSDEVLSDKFRESLDYNAMRHSVAWNSTNGRYCIIKGIRTHADGTAINEHSPTPISPLSEGITRGATFGSGATDLGGVRDTPSFPTSIIGIEDRTARFECPQPAGQTVMQDSGATSFLADSGNGMDINYDHHETSEQGIVTSTNGDGLDVMLTGWEDPIGEAIVYDMGHARNLSINQNTSLYQGYNEADQQAVPGEMVRQGGFGGNDDSLQLERLNYDVASGYYPMDESSYWS
ncbi:MAG: hypothetical protein M1827_006566 [Pycnora praestabilis]|nr:MAG: hypothetical protein M1827_006566 [Pycnora praestabilis]